MAVDEEIEVDFSFVALVYFQAIRYLLMGALMTIK